MQLEHVLHAERLFVASAAVVLREGLLALDFEDRLGEVVKRPETDELLLHLFRAFVEAPHVHGGVGAKTRAPHEAVVALLCVEDFEAVGACFRETAGAAAKAYPGGEAANSPPAIEPVATILAGGEEGAGPDEPFVGGFDLGIGVEHALDSHGLGLCAVFKGRVVRPKLPGSHVFDGAL